MAEETYYSLLEVAQTASTAEIKTAYRRLMSEVHPDRLANAPVYWQRMAEEKAKEINEAFGILSNPEKRRLYDAQLAAHIGSRNNGGTAASAQRSSTATNGTGQQGARGGFGSESRRGGSAGTTPPHPPSGQYQRQPPSPTPASQAFATKVTTGQRLFFVLVLGLFAFGATSAFWSAQSLGDELFPFVLAGSLYFAIACLYQRAISRVLRVLRIQRHQPWAVIGLIAIPLLAGRVIVSLQQGGQPHAVPIRWNDQRPAASATPVNAPDKNFPTSGYVSTSVPKSLPTGTDILRRRRNNGYGKLSVENGTTSDAVVQLVDAQTKKAIRAFYVGSETTFTETRIGPGTYLVYFMTGVDWNPVTRRFNQNAASGVFDETTDFVERRNDDTGEVDFHEFSVTLQPVVGGTARTSEIDQDAFARTLIESDSQ